MYTHWFTFVWFLFSIIVHYIMVLYAIVYLELDKQITVAVMIAMPNWFHTLCFNNIMLKKTYVIFNKLSKVIKKIKRLCCIKCNNSTFFICRGGNKSTGNIIKRFELSPRDEYNSYFQNKNKYILEYCRLHAPIVRCVSNISHKTYYLI